MTNTKGQNFNIKEFSFDQLVPSDSKADGIVQDFELRSLNDISDFKQNITEEIIRTEREMESAHGFEISPEVKNLRGLKKQAEADHENYVNAEVEKRLNAVREAAFEEGFSKGQSLGEEKALTEAREKYEEEINEFVQKVEALDSQIKSIHSDSTEEAYLMVKNLTKWIILKEVDEKYYLVRLLEKLVYEINSKSNLVIRVNENSFGYMPEVIKIVERKLSKLTNVRLEVDLDQEQNGIILESENTIVDGSLETQFKAIDKIFENAGINE